MSVEQLLEGVPIPDVVRVEQLLPRPRVEDASAELRARLRAARVMSTLKPGQTVAIGVGSRGIKGLPLLVRTLVEEVQRVGGEPFIVPSMGSHGGATAAGQLRILAHLGVTETSVNAPFRASMDTIEIGRTSADLPVWVDSHVLAADAVVVLNSVKPHVAFRGRYESGLIKMVAIGLGKQKGAETCHELGPGLMAETILAIARVALAKLNLICAVGVVESAYGDVAQLAVLRKDEIEAEEPALLERARYLAPRIPFDQLDVLIIDEIGKDIAGTGLDTNVIGRYHTPFASGGPRISRIVVLDVTDRSGGNANGIGLADFTTQRVFGKILFDQTYPNALTSTVPTTVKIPMVLRSDELAIRAAIKTCNLREKRDVRLVRIKNTKSLDYLDASTSLLDDIKSHDSLLQIGDIAPLPFDDDGNLL